MSSDCALNKLVTLCFGLAFAVSAVVLFVSDHDFQTNQRISALDDGIAGLRQESNTPNGPAVGLGTKEKRSTSTNAIPSPSGSFIRRNLELGNYKRTKFPQRTTLEIKDECGVHDNTVNMILSQFRTTKPFVRQ